MANVATKTRPAGRARPEEPTMRALTWRRPGRVGIEERTRPTLVHPADALVRVTATTICGSDLHLLHGAIPAMKRGDVLGHEFMGVVEEVGTDVRDLRVGTRVVVSAIIADGTCEYCRKGLYSLCESTNPNPAMTEMYGQHIAGVFGYSHLLGGYEGGQAEYVRVPFATVNCLEIPEGLQDEEVLFLSDIVPTSWHANELGDVGPGDVVAVWGCGPVGLLAQEWARFRGAARVIGIDGIAERLALAAERGSEVIDFRDGPPLKALQAMTEGRGVDVGIEAAGFRYATSWLHRIERRLMLETDSVDALSECIRAVRKGGRVSIVGDFVGYANHFPIGAMMEKGLTVRAGQVHVQQYWRHLLSIIARGEFDPTFVISHRMKLEQAAEAYEMFDKKRDAVVKVVLTP